jgi:hypothetical protein
MGQGIKMNEIKKEYKTGFHLNENGACIPECPFGKHARVGSTDCEYNCKSFIKVVWGKKDNFSVPVGGIVTCYGGEEK